MYIDAGILRAQNKTTFKDVIRIYYEHFVCLFMILGGDFLSKFYRSIKNMR